MWHQFLRKTSHVTEAVGTPATAVFHGVLQHVSAADEHQQWRLAKGGQVGVDDLLLRFRCRHRSVGRFAHVPFAPPADAADVHMIDARMAIVTRAEAPDEIEMCLQDGGIVQHGNLQFGAVPVARHDGPTTDIAQPARMIGLSLG